MRNYLYIIATITIVFTSSCEEKVDFDLNTDENSRLVVEGEITDQTREHIVHLTRTSSYYENQPAPREIGATVTIFDGTTSHSLTETAAGIYKTAATYKGEIGKTYTLNIATKNGQNYEASSTLESVAAIDSVSWEVIEDSEDEMYDELVLSHYGKEPKGLGNHYMWLVDINGEDFTEKASEISLITDEIIDGNYIDGIDFQGVDLVDLPDVDTLKITVEMHSISRDYFDFILAIVTETLFNGDLFSAPPANIPSNISNGGLGFFRASAVSSFSLEIENLQ